MIKQIILLLILVLSQVEGLENICKNKDENYYTKEELQAYYIRDKKVKALKKRCQNNKGDSCLILAMEHIYNFHPCETEHEKLKVKGIRELKEKCNKNSAKACFMLGYLPNIEENIDKKFYFKLACQLNKKYCTPSRQKMIKIESNEIFNYDKDKLISNKEVKERVEALERNCNIYKDAQACFGLFLLYRNRKQIGGELSGIIYPWVEYNSEIAWGYRYKTCIYSYDKLGCYAEYETDEKTPKQWIIDKAKKLEFIIPIPKFISIKTIKKSIKIVAKKRASKRLKVINFRDDFFKKEWQINDNISYVIGTTISICKQVIPKDGNWRLPLKKELLTIVDLFDKSQDFQYYWTAEQSKKDSMDYWVVDVHNGTTHEVYKNNHYDKGCVYVRDLN